MSETQLIPYIFFKGSCREAMEFYKAIFGGELTVQTYGDVNMASEETPAEYLMHAKLEDGAVVLMGSDTAKASEKSAKVSLSLGGTDDEKMSAMFEQLSAGGNVFQPLKKEFWGDTFGSLTDKFGIEWMMNIAEKKE